MDYKTISSSLYLGAILFLFMSPELVYAQFGSIELNDTKQDVIDIMGEPLSKEKGDVTELLNYEDKLDGMNVTVEFEFLDDKLISNNIRIHGPYSTDEFYRYYYERINKILEKKFGSPESRETKYIKNPVNTKPPLKDGESYSEKYLLENNFKIYKTRWELENMHISHNMGGIFGDIMHMINYRLSEYKQLKEDALIDKF